MKAFFDEGSKRQKHFMLYFEQQILLYICECAYLSFNSSSLLLFF